MPELTPALQGVEISRGPRLRVRQLRLSSGVFPLHGAQVSLYAAILEETGQKAPF